MSGPVKPIVGISARVSQGVRDFLSEEGFLLEVSQDRVRYGTYLDAAADGADEVGLLAELHRAPGPLVRLGRWPSAARSALAVTGDIDAITLRDFALRPWEAWRDSRAGAAAVPGGRDAAHSRMKGSSIGGSTGA